MLSAIGFAVESHAHHGASRISRRIGLIGQRAIVGVHVDAAARWCGREKPGDFSEALAALLGIDAAGLSQPPLPASRVDEHDAWQKRDLSMKR
jgi:hypothetical protein